MKFWVKHNPDRKLYLTIRAIENDPIKAKLLYQAVQSWVNEQVSWGGKFDYLLEAAWGEDA